MLFRVVVILAVLTGSAVAEPPSGYRCAPGKPIKGAGCSCPAGFRPKRDFDDVAVCVGLSTPSVTARFQKALERGDLAAARDIARKFDLSPADGIAFGERFKAWREATLEKVELLASRGQCSAIAPVLAPREHYVGIVYALVERYEKGRELDNRASNKVEERMLQVMKPLDEQVEKCIEVASRDDGTAKMGSEYRSHHGMLAGCLRGTPEPKAAVKVVVVVDADGKVFRTTVDGTWNDVEETSNKTEAKYRRDLRTAREQCIQKAVGTWSFKPNAHGFAGTVIIAGPGTWPTSAPGD